MNVQAALALLWLIFGICTFAVVIFMSVTVTCPEDCLNCKRINDEREAARRKRNDDFWNGRRGRP